MLSLVEERRLREAGAGQAWEDTCDAVDAWIVREGELERLTDPGVNRHSILTPNRRANLTPLSGTAEVVPVVNRGDPRGFV